jgi:hypothetical protein
MAISRAQPHPIRFINNRSLASSRDSAPPILADRPRPWQGVLELVSAQPARSGALGAGLRRPCAERRPEVERSCRRVRLADLRIDSREGRMRESSRVEAMPEVRLRVLRAAEARCSVRRRARLTASAAGTTASIACGARFSTTMLRGEGIPRRHARDLPCWIGEAVRGRPSSL